MKNNIDIKSSHIRFLLAAYAVFPVFPFLAYLLGLSFEVRNYAVAASAEIVISAVFSLLIISMDVKYGKSYESEALLLVILSTLWQIVCIFKSGDKLVICLAAIPFALSTTSYVKVTHNIEKRFDFLTAVSAAAFLLIIFSLGSIFLHLFFDDFSRTEEIERIMSPKGDKYILISETDSGALGLDSSIDVCSSRIIDLYLVRIYKRPVRIYVGDWKRENPNAEIRWINDDWIELCGEKIRVK